MSKVMIGFKGEAELKEAIAKIAPDGNSSAWIRQVVIKALKEAEGQLELIETANDGGDLQSRLEQIESDIRFLKKQHELQNKSNNHQNNINDITTQRLNKLEGQSPAQPTAKKSPVHKSFAPIRAAEGVDKSKLLAMNIPDVWAYIEENQGDMSRAELALGLTEKGYINAKGGKISKQNVVDFIAKNPKE